MQLAAILPGGAGDAVTQKLQERGIDVNLWKTDPAALESILAALNDVTIDLDGGRGQVRVCCE